MQLDRWTSAFEVRSEGNGTFPGVSLLSSSVCSGSPTGSLHQSFQGFRFASPSGGRKDSLSDPVLLTLAQCSCVSSAEVVSVCAWVHWVQGRRVLWPRCCNHLVPAADLPCATGHGTLDQSAGLPIDPVDLCPCYLWKKTSANGCCFWDGMREPEHEEPQKNVSRSQLCFC